MLVWRVRSLIVGKCSIEYERGKRISLFARIDI